MMSPCSRGPWEFCLRSPASKFCYHPEPSSNSQSRWHQLDRPARSRCVPPNTHTHTHTCLCLSGDGEIGEEEGSENLHLSHPPTFLALRVFLHRVEKTPSVQSLVVTSSVPNICEAVTALGFILISRWGEPHSVMAFINVWMQVVFPAPLGPRVIMPAGTQEGCAQD